jgi:hypothetical protein
MARQLRVRRQSLFNTSTTKWTDDWVTQAGRYRKRKALDCGKARCGLCSGHKVHGIPSHKDRMHQLRFADSLKDYFDECLQRNAEPGAQPN